MAEDQTLEGTLTDDKPSSPEETPKETAEVKETPTEEKTTEPEVDYKVKFRESQKEAIRLAKELKDSKTAEVKPEAVETETDAKTIDQIVEQKVREQVAPLTKEQQEARVDKWLDDNPTALDHLKEIEENYPNMPGKTLEQKMENAYLVATKDAAKNAGKKEMAFSIYQREQAAASGGGASSTSAEGSPPLSDMEKQVAQGLGLTEEAYATRKLESKRK